MAKHQPENSIPFRGFEVALAPKRIALIAVELTEEKFEGASVACGEGTAGKMFFQSPHKIGSETDIKIAVLLTYEDIYTER